MSKYVDCTFIDCNDCANTSCNNHPAKNPSWKTYEALIRFRACDNKGKINNDLEDTLLSSDIHEFENIEIVKIEEKEY